MTRSLPLLAVLALAGSACSTPDTTSVDAPGSTGGEAAAEAVVPTPPRAFAPATAPTGLVATARVGDLDELLRRASTLSGQPIDETSYREGVGELTGDVAFASLVDRDGAADIVFLLDAEQSMQAVAAVDLGPMRTVARALPAGVTSTARTDGSLAVEVAGREFVDPRHCSVEPTPDASRTRLVCSTDEASLEAARAYLARGLTTPVADGEARLDVAVEALRSRHGAEARGALSGATAFLEVGLAEAELPMLRDEAVRAALMVLVRDVLDDVAVLVDELVEVSVRARLDTSGVSFDLDVAVRQPSGSLARATSRLLGASARIPSDLLDQLPGGAGAYGAWRYEPGGFEDFATASADFLTAVARASAQLSQADGDALSRAFAVAMRPIAYDAAVAISADAERRSVNVVRARFASAADCERAVAAHREVLRVLRRPGVARALDQATANLGEGRPRFSEFAEFTVRGAPAGSYAFRAPTVERWVASVLTTLGLPSPDAASATHQETLIVPSGADMLLIQAADVRAAYAALAGAGRMPAALRAALESEGRGFVVAMRLADLPQQPGSDLRAELGELAANAVITVRIADTGTGGDARFEADLHMPADFIRGAASQRNQATEAPIAE